MLKPTPLSRPGRSGWSRSAQLLLIAGALPLGIRFSLMASAGAPLARWPDLVVDANSVPVAVLEALPGLGPALAGRIVAARELRPFTSLADLDRRVKGIGPAKAKAIEPFLRFAAAAPPP